MKKYETIELESADGVGTIWLSRPRTHNAFNEQMISEITWAFEQFSSDDSIRVVCLRGRGRSFCAGADLNWLKSAAKYTHDENYQESIALAKCFYAIYTSVKPTISVVHGAAIGGANGLASACDLAFCTDDAVFSLSEVKIGVVPACISPYVIKRVGECGARDLMLTGRRIDGREAQAARLVNRSFKDMAALEEHLKSRIKMLKTGGPEAITQCKKLICEVSNSLTLDCAVEYTAKMIAEIRLSPEAQEGMAAFLEKRKPGWVKE